MAAPSYTTDLATINAADATTNWTNIGTGALALETDFYVQNGACISKPGWTGDATRGGVYNNAAGITITSPNAYFAWCYFWGPAALETEANGGLQLIIGSSTTAYKQWYVRGSDTILPFDGWVCIPVDPSVTQNATTGSPTATLQYFGVLARIKAGSAIGKGNPLGIDAIRHGRGKVEITNGDLANGYGTFSGLESTANSTTNRWGLFQGVAGGYLQQGLLSLGTASTSVDFRDSNKSISIANTKKVTSGFNRIEVRHASSRVDWTNISIAALGTTSRGDFEMIAAADVNKESCVFTDMGTFIYLSSATVSNSVWRRCGQITHGGAVFSNCTIEASAASTAMVTALPTTITGCTFISAGTGHAIEITATGAYSFSGNQFTGYGSSGTTDAAIYNNSGGLVTLNISGGGATPTIRNGTGASTTTNNAVALTVSAQVTLVGAEVRVYDLDNSPTGSLGTELAGEESCATADYVYSGTVGNSVWIQIMKTGFVEFGQAFTMPAADQTIDITLLKEQNA